MSSNYFGLKCDIEQSERKHAVACVLVGENPQQKCFVVIEIKRFCRVMATVMSPHSPHRGIANKSHLSPTRSSSAATALSSMMHTTASKTAQKQAMMTPQTPVEANTSWVLPTSTIEATMSKTHHVSLEVSGLSIKNAANKFNSSLTVKLTCESSTKMLRQSGFTFSDGVAKFSIKENVMFATKNKVPRIVVEVMMGNSVMANGVMSLDIVKHLSCPVKNNAGELSRWNKFPLAASRGGKHVQVTEIVGDIEAAFDVKGEMYWSDSESGGTLTNSMTTTPASTIGSMQNGRTPATAGTLTPKLRTTIGILPNPAHMGAPNQVLTPKQSNKENAIANANNKFTAIKDATSKNVANKPATVAVKGTSPALAQVEKVIPTAPQGVSLSSEMAAESEAAVAPVVVPVVAAVVDTAVDAADVTTGRLIWFGIVLLHLFLQA